MSRRPARCTEADIGRAIKAAGKAGKPMAVEILPDGTIRITPAVDRTELDAPVTRPRREIVL